MFIVRGKDGERGREREERENSDPQKYPAMNYNSKYQNGMTDIAGLDSTAVLVYGSP